MALKVKALYKVKDATTGKVVGYKVADESDHEMTVKIEILKDKMKSGDIEVDNLKLRNNKDIVHRAGRPKPGVIVINAAEVNTNNNTATDIDTNITIKNLNRVIAEQSEHIDRITLQNENLKSQIKQSNKSNSKLIGAYNKIKELNKIIAELNAENAMLHEQIDTLMDMNNIEIKGEVNKTEIDLSEYPDVHKTKINLLEYLTKLRENIKRLESENTTLKSDKNTLNNSNRRLVLENTTLKIDKNALTNDNNKLEKEVLRLNAIINEYSKEPAKSEQVKKDNAKSTIVSEDIDTKELLRENENLRDLVDKQSEINTKLVKRYNKKLVELTIEDYITNVTLLCGTIIKSRIFMIDQVLKLAEKLELYIEEIPTDCGNELYIIHNDTIKNRYDTIVIIPDAVHEIGHNNKISKLKDIKDTNGNVVNRVKVIGGNGLTNADYMFNGCTYTINASSLKLPNVESATKLFGDTKVENFSTDNKVVLNAIKC